MTQLERLVQMKPSWLAATALLLFSSGCAMRRPKVEISELLKYRQTSQCTEEVSNGRTTCSTPINEFYYPLKNGRLLVVKREESYQPGKPGAQPSYDQFPLIRSGITFTFYSRIPDAQDKSRH
jgi:hypothetical protein